MTDPFSQSPEQLLGMVSSQRETLNEQMGIRRNLTETRNALQAAYKGSAGTMAGIKIDEACANIDNSIRRGFETMDNTESFANHSTQTGEECSQNLSNIGFNGAV